MYREEVLMTRYDAYNHVLLSFSFLTERAEQAVMQRTEDGAQAFRRRDLAAVKRVCAQLIQAQCQVQHIFQLRDDWSKMDEVADAIAELGSDGLFGVFGGEHLADDVPIAFDHLIDRLDVVVANMQECAAQAFIVSDLTKVSRFRRHAVTVMVFKLRILEAREDWMKPCLQRVGVTWAPSHLAVSNISQELAG